MEILEKYIHGSGDSTDIDVYYVVDKMPAFADAKKWCDSIKGENANLVEIRDGVIVNVYKGTPDECNNSLYRTFGLHQENEGHTLLVAGPVKRDIGLKVIRAVRIILSHLSRSQYREKIKKSLSDGCFRDRLRVLDEIDFRNIDFSACNKNLSGDDTLKVIAFQIGQTLSLLEGDELYTKSEIAERWKVLDKFLYRKSYGDGYDDLNILMKMLIYNILSIFCGDDKVCIENKLHNITKFNIDDEEVKYDLKTEKRL